MWGILILAAVAVAITYPIVDRWLDRRLASAVRNPDEIHRQQMLRWIAGRGPDPREAMFCNGVPVEQNEGPELSSLSWPPTPPLAPGPTATRTTGTSTVTGSSTATILS